MAVDLSKMSRPQLLALRGKIDNREAEMRADALKALRDKIKQQIEKEGFTVADVFGPRHGRQRKTTTPTKPKFRNPNDPTQTWVGRGKRPKWFADALAGGKSKDDLRIK